MHCLYVLKTLRLQWTACTSQYLNAFSPPVVFACSQSSGGARIAFSKRDDCIYLLSSSETLGKTRALSILHQVAAVFVPKRSVPERLLSQIENSL